MGNVRACQEGECITLISRVKAVILIRHYGFLSKELDRRRLQHFLAVGLLNAWRMAQRDEQVYASCEVAWPRNA